ncbi:MAG: hypothetical protein R2864_08740 [Syntrophotaleaceae bacterium]
MTASMSTTAAPGQLLQQLHKTRELGSFELALYDRQFLLLAISTPQAALCSSGQPFAIQPAMPGGQQNWLRPTPKPNRA